MQKTFKRDIQALGEIFDFVERYSTENAIDASALFALKFIVEELFTNMVKYNISDTQSDIDILLRKNDGKITLQLTDYGVDSFDITRVADADVTQALEERKIGGLGIHLVRKMVDSMNYEYRDRQSRITITKNLE